jgi:hypothetical protein
MDSGIVTVFFRFLQPDGAKLYAPPTQASSIEDASRLAREALVGKPPGSTAEIREGRSSSHGRQKQLLVFEVSAEGAITSQPPKRPRGT